MSENTAIGWTDNTWNPIRATNAGDTGWACIRVSEGCTNCYAEAMNKRLGTKLPYTHGAMTKVTTRIDPKVLTKPFSWRGSKRVFVCSMTDLFGDWVTDEELDRIFAIMALTPQHTYQILTKRPERMQAYIAQQPNDTTLDRATLIRLQCRDYDKSPVVRPWVSSWPLPNVWLGVTVENQACAWQRIPLLQETPAAVRWLSVEPLLEAIDLRGEWTPEGLFVHWLSRTDPEGIPGMDWVVVGGESGKDRRPFDEAWARSVVDQCLDAGVPVFAKQTGAFRSEAPFTVFPELNEVKAMPV